MTTDWPVYRLRPQDTGDLRGRYLLAKGLIESSHVALRDFALAGIRDGGHEGLVFWAGIESPPWTVLTTVVIPTADHSALRVLVSEKAFGTAAQKAAGHGVSVLAQVHSHPGADSRHSDGDDDLIILPFEGMLSIVVPYYGIHWQHLAGATVHQFQDGRWVVCTGESVAQRITVAPAVIDVRSRP